MTSTPGSSAEMAPSPPSPPVTLEPSGAELPAPAPMALDAAAPAAHEAPRRPSILLPLTPSALFAASKAGSLTSGPPSPTPSPSPPPPLPQSPSARVPSDALAARDPVSIAPHLPALHAPADTTAPIAGSSAGVPVPVPVAPPRDVPPLSSSAQSPPATSPPAAAARLWSLTAPAIPLPAFSAAPAWRRSPLLAASRSTPRSIRAAAAAAARHQHPATPHTPSPTARRTPVRSGRGTSRALTPRSTRGAPRTSPPGTTTNPLSPYLVTSTAFASNSLIHARVPDHLGVVVVPPSTTSAAHATRRTPIVVVPPRYSRISTAPIRADVYRAGKRRQQQHHAESVRLPPPKSPDALPTGYLPSPTATSSPPPEPLRGRRGPRVAARASESADWLDEEVDLGMGDSDSDFDLDPVGTPRDDVVVDMFDDYDDGGGYSDSTWALPGAATEATPLLGGKPSSSPTAMGKPNSVSPPHASAAHRTHGTLTREPSSLSVFSGAGPMRLLILVAALVAVTAFVLLAVLVVYASTHPLVGFTISVQSVTATAHDAFKMHLNVTGHNKNFMADVVLRQETPLLSLGTVVLHKHKNHFTFPPGRTSWWRVAADIRAPPAVQVSDVWRRYRASGSGNGPVDRQYYLVIAGEYTYTLAWTRHMVEPVCVVHVAPPPKGKNATAVVVP
ncbi:hypothetical protein AMAG_01005 [Allomyces macrogynus ATCC 38327]|uniref:Uncharacterized protein n=1 Tax=Allomyces macrogynus (strain ATCC 38327) TaxID=578462 RepID=A0A0L0RYA9_ALLM3|nr:hypothetical protein AMAG_01005 [Allomyces macrogynus ATCC 38327]|eukprot:KNE55069.1 hypothetical protein AMAG_01005 [Allomyces macrogynus ATCC 38327]